MLEKIDISRFDVSEEDYQAAMLAFNQAASEFRKQSRRWGNVDRQTVETWNPSIKQAGQNLCHSIRHFHALTYATSAGAAQKLAQSKLLLDCIDDARSVCRDIIESGVRNEVPSRYRTNIMLGMLNDFNEIAIGIKADAQHIMRAEAKRPRKTLRFPS